MEKILEVKNLKTYFYTHEGIVKAVDDVSFDLKKGETLGIVGESGGGKSVLASSILRLIPWPPGKIIGGSILFRSEDILKVSNRRIRSIRGNKISMIFQDPMTSLNPVFTVGNQIMETLMIHRGINKKESYKKAIELLSDVEICNPSLRVKEFPHKYSGGMRQRAMIAMALACNPNILIADEPTTALDVTIQAQILRLMRRLKEEFGSSIMLITHDLGVIAKMADFVLIMYAGKIVEYGDIEAIFYKSHHPYTWGLINSIPRVGEKVEKLYSIRGNPISVIDRPRGCSFNTRCDFAMDICFKDEPGLNTVGENHKSACFLSAGQVEKFRNGRIAASALPVAKEA
ncbi:MAG: ABC transporter ATP-binding protein [Actinobacteria bacterium]|nr:ABC transporter ATP-binding protein [Actinomycetota bacterium]